MFEVKIEGGDEVRVLKDCWAENREGEQREHEIVAGIKETMEQDDFLEYFVDICGYRKTETSGGFREVCNILTERTFEAMDNIKPQALTPTDNMSTRSSIPNQHRHPDRYAPSSWLAPEVPPHSRFRYQVVYQKEGTPLYGVTSLEKAFKYLGQTVEGTHRDSVNQCILSTLIQRHTVCTKRGGYIGILARETSSRLGT